MMEDNIHLIVRGEHFYVDRKLLEKSTYFQGLFEFHDKEIEIENIDPFIFKMIILILTNKIDDVNLEIIKTYDLFGFNVKSDFIGKLGYHCKSGNCNGISLTGKYCPYHTCCVSDCEEGINGVNNYCYNHTCKECNKLVIIGNFCKIHKCVVDNCLQKKGYINNCLQKKGYVNYCEKHICNEPHCKEPVIEKTRYCKKHTCAVDGCIYLGRVKYGSITYCMLHYHK